MIIGIDGYAGAGKDTVADILVKEGFVKVSFADALRESVVHSTDFEMNDFIDRDIKDKKFKKVYKLSPDSIVSFCTYLGFESRSKELADKFKGTKLVSPRNVLQFMATEIGRDSICQTLWLDKYLEKIQNKGEVVTPDARFANERNLIADLKGLNMFVNREAVKPTENHKSGNDKWPLDQYDIVVHNDGDMFDLKHGIRLWLRQWRKR